MYTYVFMTSIRVIPVSAVLSRVPYECLYLQKWVTLTLSENALAFANKSGAPASCVDTHSPPRSSKPVGCRPQLAKTSGLTKGVPKRRRSSTVSTRTAPPSSGMVISCEFTSHWPAGS